MQTRDPIAPVLDRIKATVQSGNRVWLVGDLPFDERPLPEIRAVQSDLRPWSDERYSFYWGVQVTQFLVAHDWRTSLVMAPSTNCVNPEENLPVVMTQWKP